MSLVPKVRRVLKYIMPATPPQSGEFAFNMPPAATVLRVGLDTTLFPCLWAVVPQAPEGTRPIVLPRRFAYVPTNGVIPDDFGPYVGHVQLADLGLFFVFEMGL
jgi:hypothetical protein